MFTLTIQPGFAEWEEPIKRYVKRENYGYNMTVYTIDNKISALLIKKRLEDEGYVIHLEEPDGSSQTTQHQTIFSGIVVGDTKSSTSN